MNDKFSNKNFKYTHNNFTHFQKEIHKKIINEYIFFTDSQGIGIKMKSLHIVAILLGTRWISDQNRKTNKEAYYI